MPHMEAQQSLSELQLEALESGNRLAADACARIKVSLSIFGVAMPDDINIVWRYIGSRTAQDRYGR